MENCYFHDNMNFKCWRLVSSKQFSKQFTRPVYELLSPNHQQLIAVYGHTKCWA